MAFKMKAGPEGPMAKNYGGAFHHNGTHPGPGKPGDKGYHTVTTTDGGKNLEVMNDLRIKEQQGDSTAILANKYMSGERLTESDLKYLDKPTPDKKEK